MELAGITGNYIAFLIPRNEPRNKSRALWLGAFVEFPNEFSTWNYIARLVSNSDSCPCLALAEAPPNESIFRDFHLIRRGNIAALKFPFFRSEETQHARNQTNRIRTELSPKRATRPSSVAEFWQSIRLADSEKQILRCWWFQFVSLLISRRLIPRLTVRARRREIPALLKTRNWRASMRTSAGKLFRNAFSRVSTTEERRQCGWVSQFFVENETYLYVFSNQTWLVLFTFFSKYFLPIVMCALWF